MTGTPTPPPGGFQQGGWYNSQQYWNGSFSAPGVINSQSNQQGAGQAVSDEVVKQTNPNNVAYIASQNNSQPSANSGAGVLGSSGGGGGGLSLPNGAPTFDLVAATNAAYNTPEIQAANKAIADANAKLTTRQQALADAQAGINDNPFYSEATRVGKSQQLTQQANNDMGVIQNEAKMAQDQLSSLKADAAIKVNAATGQYNINRQAYQDTLSNFDRLVSSGALDSASGEDIAQMAIQTGIPTSMIQSIQKNSQQKDNPVNIVQATDNEGNLSILAVDKSGKVVNTTTIAGAGKGKTGSAADAKVSANQQKSSVEQIVNSYVHNEGQQAQISPEDLYGELLNEYPDAVDYIKANWKPDDIRSATS